MYSTIKNPFRGLVLFYPLCCFYLRVLIFYAILILLCKMYRKLQRITALVVAMRLSDAYAQGCLTRLRPYPAAAVSNRGTDSGEAIIINSCSFPVYLSVCGQNPGVCTDTIVLEAFKGVFTETYNPTINNSRSIKIGLSKDLVNPTPIIQVEYVRGDNLLI